MEKFNYQTGLKNPEIEKERAGNKEDQEGILKEIAEMYGEIVEETAYLNELRKQVIKFEDYVGDFIIADEEDQAYLDKVKEQIMRDREHIQATEDYLANLASFIAAMRGYYDRLGKNLEILKELEDKFRARLLRTEARDN